MTSPYCAGVIVFHGDSVAMVKTPHGNWGFPKGKMKIINGRRETVLENALRELEEETGLVGADIDLIAGEQIDEYNDRGNLSIRYLLARLKKPDHIFSYDNEELNEVRWVKVSEALKFQKLKVSRKNILQQADAIVNPT